MSSSHHHTEPLQEVDPEQLLPAGWPHAVTDLVHVYALSRQHEMAAMGPEITRWLEALDDFVCQGGKRIRPVFAWLGWCAGGGSADSPLAPAMQKVCAALEFLQAGALIHDDIIDASSTRRGQPSVHIAFARDHAARLLQSAAVGNSENYGLSSALLLGDIALCWADDMVHSAGLPSEQWQAALPFWTAMRSEVLGGQFLDIHAETQPFYDVDTAWRVNRYKTAAYTVLRPLQMGAACGGASSAVLDKLTPYGVNVGIAFQLRDDLLGVFAQAVETGKPSGEDLREGKHTELVSIAMDNLSSAHSAELSQLLGRDLTDAELRRARELLSVSGAVQHIEQRITALATEARATVQELAQSEDISPAVAGALLTMVDRATTRIF